MTRVFTLEEAADLLRVSTKTIRREGRRGRLVLTRIGGQKLRVQAEDIEAYLALCRRETNARRFERPRPVSKPRDLRLADARAIRAEITARGGK